MTALQSAIGATKEKRFETRLFDHTPNGVVPYVAGARIPARAQQIEAEMFEPGRLVVGADVRRMGFVRGSAKILYEAINAQSKFIGLGVKQPD